MTQPLSGGQDALGPLDELVVQGTLGLWAPPLVMAVVGDPEVLGVVVQGLTESHTSVPGHALRVATATVKGLTNPGDGSYAERLRQAHEHWGVNPAQIAKVWQWSVVAVHRADALTNGNNVAHARAGQLLRAAQMHGLHVNADQRVVGQPLSLDEEQMAAHFGAIIEVSGTARDAFWEVADHPQIRALLPADVNDSAVLTHCAQFLPETFVALFVR